MQGEKGVKFSLFAFGVPKCGFCLGPLQTLNDTPQQQETLNRGNTEERSSRAAVSASGAGFA